MKGELSRVEVILSETEQSTAAGADLRGLCEKAARETLRLEGRKLAGLVGGAPGGNRAVGRTGSADGRVVGASFGPVVEVGVTLTGDPGIRELNRRYLGRDRTTDVLSFFMGDEQAGEEPYLLGDVVVSVDTARTQAADYERPYPEELARLVSHGTLHLLGHADDNPEAAAAMHAKEDAVLKALGFESGEP